MKAFTIEESYIAKERLTIFKSKTDIQAAIKKLSLEINAYYKQEKGFGSTWNGENLVALVTMNGAMYFAADLTRALELPGMTTEHIYPSSYVNGKNSGEVVMNHKAGQLFKRIKDKHVLIIEDIVDTGKTMQKILPELWAMNPRSIEIATLLDKKVCREVEGSDPRFYAFEIPKVFVLGYGLDNSDGTGRTLDDLYTKELD